MSTLALLVLAAGAVLVSLRPPNRRDASFAGPGDVRALRARRGGPPRLALGVRATSRWRATRQQLASPPDSSLLVLGPTQSGKTSSLVIPALLRWRGPVLAASVKTDLVEATAAWRAGCGPIGVLDPADVAQTWSVRFEPVAVATTIERARAAAASLCEAGADDLPGADAAFWAQLATKLLSPLLLAANLAGGDLGTVSSWIDRRERLEIEAILLDAGELTAAEWLAASFDRDERQLSSVLATLEAVLGPLLGSLAPAPLDLDELLRSDGTLYLCAAAHDQRRHRALFTAVTEQLLAQAFSLARRQGGRLERPLLVILDEAAAIAPLRELDVVAATCASHGITLVTCFQDLAQIRARYGERAPTVVNNHTTRVALSGLADPGAAELLGALVGSARVHTSRVWKTLPETPAERRALLEPHELRRMPPHSGIVVSGRIAPVRVRLVPWWRQAEVRRRGPGAVDRYAPRREGTATHRR